MLIVFHSHATEADILAAAANVEALGLSVHRSDGVQHTVLGLVGESRGLDPQRFAVLPGVREVLRVSTPYRLASRGFRQEPTVVSVGEVAIGGEEVVLIAGPCAVESEQQIGATAAAVAAAGGRILRGGAYKPRTSPHEFQGLGSAGLALLRRAADRHGLGVCTEVLGVEQIEAVAAMADLLQVGARNMQNFPLLQALGRAGRPVLLKRGLSATINEWLAAAEYILAAGNPDVILCERGIRTFETATRSTLDVAAVPVVKELSHLPVIVDPSHAAGNRRLVPALARAAVAAGADGLLIEVHPDPDHALSDGAQSLTPEQLTATVNRCRMMATALGRRLAPGGLHA
jgi:3-deoxy-7-phosphoheptulonate synthase